MTRIRSIYAGTLILLASSLALFSAAANDWPGLSKNEAFHEETWEPSRVLVYAKPGSDGDVTSTSSWLEYASMADYKAGKKGRVFERREKLNLSEHTDIILPEAPAGKPYTVGYMSLPTNQSPTSVGYRAPTFVFRHLFVGKGASLDCGYGQPRRAFTYSKTFKDDSPALVYGNVTVQDGASLYAHFYFVGDKNTFIQIGESSNLQGHAFKVEKGGNASVTYLAKKYDLVMGLHVTSGRFVLGPESSLKVNATYEKRLAEKKITDGTGYDATRSNVVVQERAALELRSGALLGQLQSINGIAPNIHLKGLLQVGAPQQTNRKPITIELDMVEGSGKYLEQSGGLYVRPTANVVNHGTLVITTNDSSSPASQNKGISLFLEKTVDFGEVTLDYVRSGGISARNPAASKALLSQATIGSQCAMQGDKLTSTISGIDFTGGFGIVEFVDGLQTECEILYPHPNAPRLVVRSKGHRTVQTFDLRTIHRVTVGDKRTEFNAKRSLSKEEENARGANVLWGDGTDDGQLGYYGNQNWDKKPLQVWATPGKSGKIYIGPNWLDEKGTPCFESLIGAGDEMVDILVPAADKTYELFGYDMKEGNMRVRHFTTENQVTWSQPFTIQGNVWMKHGSNLSAVCGTARYENDRPEVHRFLRYETPRQAAVHWYNLSAHKDGTMELIGEAGGAQDRLWMNSGTLIVSEGSILSNGHRAAFAISPEATVVLLQDAVIGCRYLGPVAQVSLAGTLMIGHPDKPITRDMDFAMRGVIKDKWAHSSTFNIRARGTCLTMTEDSHFKIYSADPTKARVHFKLHNDFSWHKKGEKYHRDQKEEIFGIAMTLAGNADLNGAVFHNVAPGGIAAHPETRAKWKNISYGDGNMGSPDELNVRFQASAEPEVDWRSGKPKKR